MKALIIIDMQNDFMPTGALPVPHGDELIGLINRLMPHFPLVIATQDYHPSDHVSFADNHKAGEVIDGQVLWKRHCVQGTSGVELVKGLDTKHIHYVVHKGMDAFVDSYSAFFDNRKLKSTGLDAYLKQHRVTEIYLVGVALDYCVLYTALDALDLGYRLFVIVDGCKELMDKEGPLEQIRQKGGRLVYSNSIL